MERRQFTFILIAVLIVLFIWNPFSRRDKNQKVPPPRVTQEQAESMANYISGNGRPPEEFVAGMFDDRDIVFIGESTKIKEQVEFIQSVIPHLYEAGVKILAVEHALRDDQLIIDDLITASVFDERKARQILFNRYVMWGFREYVDIFRAAWELNSGLSRNQEPFRILGAAVKQDWTVLKTQKDLKNQEVKRQILAYGMPSTFMADTLESEVIDRGEKALVFCSIQQSFTRYQSKQYQENAQKEGYDEVRGAGNIVYDRIGSKAATVCMHLFWPDLKSQYGVAFSVGGIVDAAMSILPENEQRAGFSTSGNPASDVPIESGVYTYGYDELTMKDIYDGYLIFGPLHQYHPATPIPDFFNQANIEAALANFPAPKDTLPPTKTQEDAVKQLNDLLSGEAQNTAKFLEMFAYS
jgi:hypothetical protein